MKTNDAQAKGMVIDLILHLGVWFWAGWNINALYLHSVRAATGYLEGNKYNHLLPVGYTIIEKDFIPVCDLKYK